jgi:hypothetical protein
MVLRARRNILYVTIPKIACVELLPCHPDYLSIRTEHNKTSSIRLHNTIIHRCLLLLSLLQYKYPPYCLSYLFGLCMNDYIEMIWIRFS